MPRYFMHICNGSGFVEDEEGLELPSESVAREAAIRAARDVMANDLRGGDLDLSSFIEVEDGNKQLLFTIHFIDAVNLTSRHTGQAKRSGRS